MKHPDILDLEVQVLCRGAPLEEYVEDDPETVFPLVYVESISGEKFASTCLFGPDYPHRQVRAGKSRGSYTASSVKVYENGRPLHRVFSFSRELDFDDDPSWKKDDGLIQRISKLGTLEVCLSRVVAKVDVHPERMNSKEKNMDRIHEKALKGRVVSHSTEFGPALPCNKPPITTGISLKIDEKPFASFTFKYLSKRKLQDLLIVPRTPSPEPLNDRAIESMTESELRRALREARAKGPQRTGPTVKQEMKRELEDGAEGARIVKEARRSCARIETIDLTSDT